MLRNYEKIPVRVEKGLSLPVLIGCVDKDVNAWLGGRISSSTKVNQSLHEIMRMRRYFYRIPSQLIWRISQRSTFNFNVLVCDWLKFLMTNGWLNTIKPAGIITWQCTCVDLESVAQWRQYHSVALHTDQEDIFVECFGSLAVHLEWLRWHVDCWSQTDNLAFQTRVIYGFTLLEMWDLVHFFNSGNRFKNSDALFTFLKGLVVESASESKAQFHPISLAYFIFFTESSIK